MVSTEDIRWGCAVDSKTDTTPFTIEQLRLIIKQQHRAINAALPYLKMAREAVIPHHEGLATPAAYAYEQAKIMIGAGTNVILQYEAEELKNG
jgi:hypothetical protein